MQCKSLQCLPSFSASCSAEWYIQGQVCLNYVFTASSILGLHRPSIIEQSRDFLQIATLLFLREAANIYTHTSEEP